MCTFSEVIFGVISEFQENTRLDNAKMREMRRKIKLVRKKKKEEEEEEEEEEDEEEEEEKT